jgi:hypothetical protein
MDPFAPFTGVLLLPDRQVFGTTAPVTLASGEPVAAIRWHRWTGRARFDVLDSRAQDTLAMGGREGYFGRRYAVGKPTGEDLVAVEFGFWGLGRAAVTLPDGSQLTAKGNWTGRKFEMRDAADRPVAVLANTSGFLSLRPDSFALELLRPALSIVQAAGVAQCIRAALEADRSASAGGAAAAVG